MTLPTFARLQKEAAPKPADGTSKGASQQGKPVLPTAHTGGKTREYLQLAVGRLQWLVEAGKAGAAHTAVLVELEESGMVAAWGVVQGATLLPPAV